MSIINQLPRIESGLTPKEICQAAEIDYKIEKMPTAYLKDGSYHQIKDKNAVVTENGEVFGICGNNWHIFQNEDIITTAYEVFRELGMQIERAGKLDNGKRIACVGSWKKEFEVGVGDIVSTQILLIGSHQVGLGHELRSYFNRLICTNGMTQRLRGQTKIFGHTQQGVKSLVNSILDLNLIAGNYQQNAQTLAKNPVTIEEATILLINQFGDATKPVDQQPKIVQTVLRLFSGEGKGSELLTSYNTAWGLLNSVTEYYNHHARQANLLQSLTVGSYANNISKFHQTLTQRVAIH